jgi:hypothetical protein
MPGAGAPGRNDHQRKHNRLQFREHKSLQDYYALSGGADAVRD